MKMGKVDLFAPIPHCWCARKDTFSRKLGARGSGICATNLAEMAKHTVLCKGDVTCTAGAVLGGGGWEYGPPLDVKLFLIYGITKAFWSTSHYTCLPEPMFFS